MTSTLGIVALSVALLTFGAALVKHRGAWRTPEALIPGAIVLATLHVIVPMSDRVQVSLATLSLLISGSMIWQFIRRGRTNSAG